MYSELRICGAWLGLGSNGQPLLLAVGLSCRTAHDHRKLHGDRGCQDRDVKGDTPSEPERREGRLTDQKLNLSANWPCLPPLAEVTLPKLNGSLTLEEGPPKICRLKALNISKRNSMFICS